MTDSPAEKAWREWFHSEPGFPEDRTAFLAGWHARDGVLAETIRQAKAEALEEFAAKWQRWMPDAAPQIRGGAAYRARAEAAELRKGDER